jgi:GDP/UDP-N,N'-diacetylbacillosamine 2-epimerase (hydrolysing)
MRNICYITGTRADFGLMKNTLHLINIDKNLSLKILVTGMHLLHDYGYTYDEIVGSGFSVSGKAEVSLSGSSDKDMSIALGEQIIKFTKFLEALRPDLTLLLGDRGEMLAGAIASIHLNIPIVHIHGGELSGTIDEPIRHAISKLSHYHFTSTEKSKNRLIKMGENPNNIFVTGAPGLDGINEYKNYLFDLDLLLKKYNLIPSNPFILFLYHPVVQDYQDIDRDMEIIVESLLEYGEQVLALMPNSDYGSKKISDILQKYGDLDLIKIVPHIERSEYLFLLSKASILVGNSSSGIIEAGSLGAPVVNIGSRQNSREKGNNVINTKVDKYKIVESFNKAKNLDKSFFQNPYDIGRSSDKILSLLKTISLDEKVLNKINAY